MARNAILELLQAASNAAASNVSGPVDLLGMGLRRLGVPVPEDAVGSSAWMAQRGLTREVQNPLLRVAGETFGLTAPIAAAARAPQVAAAVNQAIANLQAQRAAGQAAAQRGAIVWHGSPHKFDKFDSSKIGTGEGAQVYGHGIYLADSPDVAMQYRKNLADKSSVIADFQSARNANKAAWDSVDRLGYDSVADAKAAFKADPFAHGLSTEEIAALRRAESVFDDAYLSSAPGATYKVDLPDEAIARMLDWDAPLSQQAPEVQKAMSAALADRGITKSVADYIVANKSGNEALATLARGAYDARLNVPDGAMAADASRRLQNAGIPGIRYLDGNSRGVGAGTRNYVVFPGEENALLRILERNGQPLP